LLSIRKRSRVGTLADVASPTRLGLSTKILSKKHCRKQYQFIHVAKVNRTNNLVYVWSIGRRGRSLQENIMKTNTRIAVILTTGCALMLMTPIRTASAESFEHLSAEWWQWALSIPTVVNPQLDTTGENAVVGQHGKLWFLAGVFGGGTVIRDCSVPEGTALFFPVINSVNIDTPGVCGQEGSLSVEELRAASAGFVDGATNLSVTVDMVAIKHLRRVQSKVFAVALPEDNVFDAPCGSNNVPVGIYSPAVDDGFYVLLDKLSAGKHTLHFHAENPSQSFVQDVTYHLTVVPVSTK
jgi:hypothetical protein